jgi:signal transduction histidine kinase
MPAYPAYHGSAGPSDARAGSPPLTKRLRRSHWIAIDCVAGVFIALLATVSGSKSLPVSGNAGFWLDLLLFVLVFLPVALRRRAPVTAFGGLVILGILMSGLSPGATAGVFLAAAYVLYTVTVESKRRTGVAALALLIVVSALLAGAGTHVRTGPVRAPGGVVLNQPQPASSQNRAGPGVLIPVTLASVIAWMTGYSVRQRRRYIVTLQQQAASSAVAQERLRIARELHDVVAHSMSVIAVQAGYGQYVIDASPGGAKEALGAIQATSRDALEEMRRMLGVLRQQDGPPSSGGNPAGLPGASPTGSTAAPQNSAAAQDSTRPLQAPLAPAPGMASLDRLIERTRGAGLEVTLDVAGHARPAPAGVDLAAYRIIQEALTNVVRHAGTAARCTVSVAYTDSDLVIRVTDDGGLPVTFPVVSVAAAGSGHGIIGMRERVQLCGGSFSALPRPEGGFCVMAALPLPAVDLLTARGRTVRTGPAAAAGGAAPDAGAVPQADQVSGFRR